MSDIWDLMDSDLTGMQSKILSLHLLLFTMTPGGYKILELMQWLLSEVSCDITRWPASMALLAA